MAVRERIKLSNKWQRAVQSAVVFISLCLFSSINQFWSISYAEFLVREARAYESRCFNDEGNSFRYDSLNIFAAQNSFLGSILFIKNLSSSLRYPWWCMNDHDLTYYILLAWKMSCDARHVRQGSFFSPSLSLLACPINIILLLECRYIH